MLLLVGGDSEIGATTFLRLRARGQDVITTTRRPTNIIDNVRLDLNDPPDVWKLPSGVSSACILVGVTRPKDCASDPEASAHVNVTRTLTLADRLISEGIHVLFVSSDQVFDGRVPFVPAETPTNPVSEYGRQKARTEASLRIQIARGAPVAILRLSKVVSPQTRFLQEWIQGLRSGSTIRVFHDKTIAPVPVTVVADAIEALSRDQSRGIFQLTGPRDVGYAEAARQIVRRLGADSSQITQVRAASLGLPVGSTPLHTTLDSTEMRDRYGILAPDVWQVIDELLEEAKSG
jgi:dTDP-4-dehydrorhamnose reductase